MGHFLGALMKYKTSELTGALLDAAVALAEGFPQFWIDNESDAAPAACVLGPTRGQDSRFEWAPSTEWNQGGPIIERERIALVCSRPRHGTNDGQYWDAYFNGNYTGPDGQVDSDDMVSEGPTPLIAAMRAYVAHKLGDEVELASRWTSATDDTTKPLQPVGVDLGPEVGW